eukprot:Awhi_evm2s10336
MDGSSAIKIAKAETQVGPRSKINAHCLDINLGKPAAGVHVVLEFQMRNDSFRSIGKTTTDAGGHADNLILPSEVLNAGVYRITFYP